MAASGQAVVLLEALQQPAMQLLEISISAQLRFSKVVLKKAL
jgi:hypothetical protein